jgi:hypothetical protein
LSSSLRSCGPYVGHGFDAARNPAVAVSRMTTRVARAGGAGLESATSGVTGRARSATILQEAARRDPRSREFASAPSSGFNDLARACSTVPPILCPSRRRLSRQPSKTATGRCSRRESRRACLPRPAGRGRNRDCLRQGRSERGTAGPHRTRPVAWWSRRRCSGFAVLRPHGQPSRSCVVGITVGESRRRLRGEKLFLSCSDRCPNASHGRPRTPPSPARVWQAARPLLPPRAPPRPRACRRRLPGRGRGSCEARCPAPAA